MKDMISIFLLVAWILISPVPAVAEKLIFSKIYNSPNSLISEMVLKEAYGQIGVRFVMKPYPGIRALRYSNIGKIDGEIHRIADTNVEYQNLIMIPVPVNTIDGQVFTKNHEFTVNGWKSLAPYKIGIAQGILFSEIGTSGLNRYISYNYKELFQVLSMDRVDMVVVPRLIGLEMIQELCLSDIKAMEPPIERVPLYHYLHKKHRHIIPRITSILEKMEKEGAIRRIRRQFIQENFSRRN